MEQVGAGNVVVRLGDAEYVLVPTLAAAQGISRMAGGIRGAIDGVVKADLDVIMAVVRFGLGPRVAKEIGDKLPELVWKSGLTDSTGEISARCVEYLSILANGGRPLSIRSEADAENPTITH